MHLINIASIFVILLLIGVEFSVSAVVTPSARRLEREPQIKILSHVASVLGRVMPFWYSACLLLLGIETWLHWHTSDFGILLTASAIWVLASVASFIFLVPLNNRVAEGVADWQRIHRTWEKRNRVRIATLVIAAVLLTFVVVR